MGIETNLEQSGLLNLQPLLPALNYDIVYATADNFFGRAVYPAPAAWLHKDAVQPLQNVLAELQRQKLGLLLYDGYRPWSVTRLFWEESSAAVRAFLADPAEGSGHNRGTTVDVTLTDHAGAPLEMCSGFDEFSERAYAAYSGGSRRARRNRDLLISVMSSCGFAVDPREWWHFELETVQPYPLLDVPLQKLQPLRQLS